jgi:hypothetical protein
MLWRLTRGHSRSGPQRQHGRDDQHGKPEDPDPQGPDGQAVEVAATDNRQAETRYRQADQATITRRQARLAQRPLTRSMMGGMRRTEGVVQRTGHPYDHDHADAHGNGNPCEHGDHLRVGQRRGTSSRRQQGKGCRSSRLRGTPNKRNIATGVRSSTNIYSITAESCLGKSPRTVRHVCRPGLSQPVL